MPPVSEAYSLKQVLARIENGGFPSFSAAYSAN